MRHAQVLAFDVEDRLADLLRELAQANGLWLRPVRHAKTCINLLRQGADVLVLRLGKDLEREMTLLDQVSRLFPATRTVAIGNLPNPALAALAWDLGAAYVLFPPEPIEVLREVLLSLLLPLPAHHRGALSHLREADF